MANAEKKQKKNIPDKAIVFEFIISMHCNGYERAIAKTISKIKGVDKFVTDMINNKVVIMGKIDPQRVMKKPKETGKAVEMVVKEEEPKEATKDEESVEEMTNQSLNFLLHDYLGDDFFYYTMFSDENANACATM